MGSSNHKLTPYAISNNQIEDSWSEIHPRELETHELYNVSGGYPGSEDDPITQYFTRGFTVGGAIGTIGGAAFTGATIGATRWGIIGSALGGSFGFGYGVGTVIYNSISS